MGFLVEPNAGTDDLAERFNQPGQMGGGSGKRQVSNIQYLAHIPGFSILAVYPD
jgi:hypothetical protein